MEKEECMETEHGKTGIGREDLREEEKLTEEGECMGIRKGRKVK